MEGFCCVYYLFFSFPLCQLFATTCMHNIWECHHFQLTFTVHPKYCFKNLFVVARVDLCYCCHWHSGTNTDGYKYSLLLYKLLPVCMSQLMMTKPNALKSYKTLLILEALYCCQHDIIYSSSHFPKLIPNYKHMRSEMVNADIEVAHIGRRAVRIGVLIWIMAHSMHEVWNVPPQCYLCP